MASRFKFAEELWPVGFGLADEDHVRMRLRLIGHQGYMGSAQDHRSSPPPELVCHGIDVRCTRGMKSNRHQVHEHLKIHRPHNLIDMDYRPMRRYEGGKIRHCDLLEVQNATTPYPLDFWRGSGDQKYRLLTH